MLHDTTTFGEQGETPGHRGLWPAVEEFLAQGTFRLKARYENNNGLAVLEAVGAEADEPVVVEAVPGAAPADAALTAAAAPDGTPRELPPVRMAVVCIAHDEEELIGPFLDHYFGQGADAVFIVDNDCTDSTVEIARRRPNVTVERLESGELDEELRTATFQRLREACAGKFDWVLLVDCDEFLVPKEAGTLKEELARHAEAGVLGAEGWDVAQRPGEPRSTGRRPCWRSGASASPTGPTTSRWCCGRRGRSGWRRASTTCSGPTRGRRRGPSGSCTSPPATSACSSSAGGR